MCIHRDKNIQGSLFIITQYQNCEMKVIYHLLRNECLLWRRPEKERAYTIETVWALNLRHTWDIKFPSSHIKEVRTGGINLKIDAAQWLSRVWLFATAWIVAHLAPMSLTVSLSLLKLKSIELVMPSNHLILCHPFLLMPSIFPSIRVLSNESGLFQWVGSLHRWPKYWSFSCISLILRLGFIQSNISKISLKLT